MLARRRIRAERVELFKLIDNQQQTAGRLVRRKQALDQTLQADFLFDQGVCQLICLEDLLRFLSEKTQAISPSCSNGDKDG